MTLISLSHLRCFVVAFQAALVQQHVAAQQGRRVQTPQLQRHRPNYDCPYCERKFGFQNQLEMHLCNGWCKGKKPTGSGTRFAPSFTTERIKFM